MAAPAPAAAPVLLSHLFGGLADGGAVVRVHRFFRSPLSPEFFAATRIGASPGAEWTFDAEVCDGREKVRGPALRHPRAPRPPAAAPHPSPPTPPPRRPP